LTKDNQGASALPTGLSQAEPQGGLGPSGFDPSRWHECLAGFADAVSELPGGWWFSVGVCSVSCHASIGPDVAYCDKATLIAFDEGFHADIPQPSTVAGALRDCIEQAGPFADQMTDAEIAHITNRDSDGSPEGRDRQDGLDGAAATARAEGIAQ
jgi:hypothetical protein